MCHRSTETDRFGDSQSDWRQAHQHPVRLVLGLHVTRNNWDFRRQHMCIGLHFWGTCYLYSLIALVNSYKSLICLIGGQTNWCAVSGLHSVPDGIRPHPLPTSQEATEDRQSLIQASRYPSLMLDTLLLLILWRYVCLMLHSCCARHSGWLYIQNIW